MKRRPSHGSVFNFQIPGIDVGSKIDFGEDEISNAGENEIQRGSLLVARMGRHPSVQSQASHCSHPATPNYIQNDKWNSTDDCNGMPSLMRGGNAKAYHPEPTSPEGSLLPPVMEIPGKGDLVRKLPSFRNTFHIKFSSRNLGFTGCVYTLINVQKSVCIYFSTNVVLK